MKWAERVTGISDVILEASVNVILPDKSSQNSTRTCSMGWALKATKKRPGLGEKVKAYLVEKFEAGERSGTKADPLSVSREMKFLNKGDNGKLIFTPEEWKAQQSIKSFLSRYSAKLRKQEIDKPRDMHSTEQEIEDRRRRYRSFGVRNGHA